MKLTNTQLEIVAKSIYASIKVKEESIKSSEEFIERVTQAKEQEIFISKSILSERYAHTLSEIESLKESLQRIREEHRALTLDNSYIARVPSLEALEELEEKRVLAEMTTDLPSLEEVKAAIILQALDGSEDLIQEVKNKFNID